jgi:hypothetical protein
MERKLNAMVFPVDQTETILTIEIADEGLALSTKVTDVAFEARIELGLVPAIAFGSKHKDEWGATARILLLDGTWYAVNVANPTDLVALWKRARARVR